VSGDGKVEEVESIVVLVFHGELQCGGHVIKVLQTFLNIGHTELVY
jgi:hypothetical protein